MARSSSKKFRRVYWDACIWISLIGNEVAVHLKNGKTENRAALARAILDEANKGSVEIVTSALSLIEVNKISPNPGSITDTEDKLAEFFENDFIVVAQLNRQIGETARKLMQRGLPGLKPLDAAHLATAMIANVDEMHSFDDKLLTLDEKIDKRDGTPLKICKPSMSGTPLPLLESPPEVLDAPPDSTRPTPTAANESAADSKERNDDSATTPEDATRQVHRSSEEPGMQRKRDAIPHSASTSGGGALDGAGQDVETQLSEGSEVDDKSTPPLPSKDPIDQKEQEKHP